MHVCRTCFRLCTSRSFKFIIRRQNALKYASSRHQIQYFFFWGGDAQLPPQASPWEGKPPSYSTPSATTASRSSCLRHPPPKKTKQKKTMFAWPQASYLLNPVMGWVRLGVRVRNSSISWEIHVSWKYTKPFRLKRSSLILGICSAGATLWSRDMESDEGPSCYSRRVWPVVSAAHSQSALQWPCY